MQSLIIEAVSRESARGFMAALAEFETELVEAESGRCQVRVALVGSDRVIVSALRALEDYITARGDGAAKVVLDGKTYTMQPAP